MAGKRFGLLGGRPVGSHLRGDRFYGEILSPGLATQIVRSEIGPYRRLLPEALVWPSRCDAGPAREKQRGDLPTVSPNAAFAAPFSRMHGSR
jgi:hypothetical protein